MPVIRLQTLIAAPAERVFDLSRSVEVHLGSTSATGERVVAGRHTGLFETGDVVTWSAVHFGIRQRLTVEITAMDRPRAFADRMIKGLFRHMHHEHRFKEVAGGCAMEDVFDFAAPGGPLGRLAEALVLTRYLRRLLRHRNAEIKRIAEGEEWRRLLPE